MEFIALPLQITLILLFATSSDSGSLKSRLSSLFTHTFGLSQFLGFTKSHEDTTQWQMEVK